MESVEHQAATSAPPVNSSMVMLINVNYCGRPNTIDPVPFSY